MFETLFGTEIPLAIGLCLAFLIVLGLIGAVAWAPPMFGKRRGSGSGQSRLSIIDSVSVDKHRRLILIRRDNVEHLLLIGGPTDVVIELNMLHATVAPLEVPVTRSSAAAELRPRVIPQLDKGSRPLLTEPAAMPRPVPQIEPMPQEPAAGQLRAQAETSTRLQRDTLAALANELSSRPPAPRKNSATVARPHPIEPRSELRTASELRPEADPELRSEPDPESQPEHRVEPQPEPPMEAPQPARAAAAETASTADEDLAELARLLEVKLRKPNVPVTARPSAALAPLAPPPQRAPAAEAVPTSPSPVRAQPPSEPKPPRTAAKPSQAMTSGDSLEQQLASLLGRVNKN
jgi:flagellar protein FliO/FliZ